MAKIGDFLSALTGSPSAGAKLDTYAEQAQEVASKLGFNFSFGSAPPAPAPAVASVPSAIEKISGGLSGNMFYVAAGAAALVVLGGLMWLGQRRG